MCVRLSTFHSNQELKNSNLFMGLDDRDRHIISVIDIEWRCFVTAYHSGFFSRVDTTKRCFFSPINKDVSTPQFFQCLKPVQ